MYIAYKEYMMYNKYMKYTVSEARKNLRKLLNQADSGEEVIIERFDEEYVLLARMGASDVKKYFADKVPMSEVVAKEQTPRARRAVETAVKQSIEDQNSIRFCKHGYDPKMCKFAKVQKNGERLCR